MKAKNDFYNYLTKGRDYNVLNSLDTLYLVVADNGVRVWLDKTLFESDHLSNAKRIASEAEALAERERVRDNILGKGWKIHAAGMMIASSNYEPNEYVKILEQLREILRVPEGENILTHAKVVRALADALIDLQK